jgi:hypothetical protein
VIIAGLVGNVLVNTVLQALILQMLIPPLSIVMAITLKAAPPCRLHGSRGRGIVGKVIG